MAHDGVAKTWQKRMGMNQGAGVNGDAGMDNMTHVNKGWSESTRHVAWTRNGRHAWLGLAVAC